MQQVADWLEKLGLGQYAERFAENDISFVILPDLTDQDLEKIGMASLGHRRLLLRAIAELKIVERGARTPDNVVSAPPASAKMDTAERRQVTVMFSDLVGSTALSARMDPEDLREVISAYHKCVANTVQRFGGFVAKYMGDGVLIYFGYPQAHEDDAERAVRAGLELVAAVTALKTRSALQTRVGIATGLVVVGDLIGSGASQEQAIVGETPNLAARLQTLAAPNTLVIADATRRQSRRPVRSCRSRPASTRGLCRAATGVAGPRRERGVEPVRGVALGGDAARRARRGNRAAAATLGAGEERRRKGGANQRRAGDRQVAAHCRRFRSGSQTRPTPACAISARRTTRTVRFIPSSCSSNAPPGSRATTRPNRSLANCGRCSPEARDMRMISHC